MVHPDFFPKPILSTDVKPVGLEVDVGKKFTNEQQFIVCDYMLQLILTEAVNLEFLVVIGRLDNGTYRRNEFVNLRCERSGQYTNLIQKLWDNIDSRKFESDVQSVSDSTPRL